MNNSKGISVLALVITVVVMIIITSMTVYTGVSMISDARKKDASDKLKVICNEIRKNDNFLNVDEGTFTFSESHLDQLGLLMYYNEDYPIEFNKEIKTVAGETMTVYKLTMYDGDNILEPYAEEYFISTKKLEKNNYEISFDDSRGVNRPILYSNMYALSSVGNTFINDIFEETWYDYMSISPSFAKMQYGSGDDNKGIYVWIPRYAYSIQTYYNGLNDPSRLYAEVPNTAIKIVFLQDTTNYMGNGEIIPTGYKVHPAFSNKNGELSGIWIAIDTSEDQTSLSNAVSNATEIAGISGNERSHLMTNSEFSAALYLMYATKSLEQINFTRQNEFVAATIKGVSGVLRNLDYCDEYELDSEEEVTGLENKYGDAMVETNWNRMIATYPTSSKPCIVRALKSGYFDFFSITDTSGSYNYRSVIITK